MNPAIVFPIHDPEGAVLGHIRAITPDLKALFARAFISITPQTMEAHNGRIRPLQADDFFDLTMTGPAMPVGDQFRHLYQRAATACSPAQILHLCFLDRVAFALRTHFRKQFIADLRAIQAEHTPLLFQRSEAAWDSHPRNYREIEHMATRAGEWLFGRTLDFAWCHLAVQAGHLRTALPCTHQHDMSILTELVLHLRSTIKTSDVDWLSWEDPFILSRDLEQLKGEREESLAETHKRLAYIVPMLQRLITPGDSSD
ncbi:MAG: hypothetical protein M1546_15935 [Chloroflexi bacterium]|nr:hypothetical protein [Chloroflexota bacterium]